MKPAGEGQTIQAAAAVAALLLCLFLSSADVLTKPAKMRTVGCVVVTAGTKSENTLCLILLQ